METLSSFQKCLYTILFKINYNNVQLIISIYAHVNIHYKGNNKIIYELMRNKWKYSINVFKDVYRLIRTYRTEFCRMRRLLTAHTIKNRNNGCKGKYLNIIM